jgi:hypothetical protein
LNYFSAENLRLKGAWLLGSIMIILNLLNMMAWSQHYFIHISFYIFLLALIATSILKDKTDDRLLLGIFFFGCLWVLTEPVTDWDARSIWFFHAKRIFIDNHLYAQLDNYAPWSHNDYPPLLPSLAASIAKSLGFWNEYLPRISILLALFPILLISKWLFSNQLAFNLWVLGLLLICKTSLINGYMDSLLAIYIASGCLLITKIYSNTKNKSQYYFPLILVLASLPLIKNEGLLATLIFILLLIPRFNKETIYVALSILSISIYLLFWKYPLILNNIHSDLFSSDVFSIITQRIHNPDEIILIFKSIIKQLWIFLLIPLGLLVKYKKIEKITLLFACFIFTYLAAMVVIYILSPHNLSWHLNTSIKRTMLPIKVCIFSMLIYLQFSLKSFKKYNTNR